MTSRRRSRSPSRRRPPSLLLGRDQELARFPRSWTKLGDGRGFALPAAMPLERRIEQSLLIQLETLPEPTRNLLFIAAADPTGDPGLLWRASTILGLKPENADPAVHDDALDVGQRVEFRHPLIRSSVYQSGFARGPTTSPRRPGRSDSRRHGPDRRAWRRAQSTVLPDEGVASRSTSIRLPVRA